MTPPPAARAVRPNVGRAGGIMMASLLLSRVLGLVREMVIAGKFGADATVDAYRLAFSIPDVLFFLIAGGALSSAFIPVFSEALHQGREEDAWRTFSVVVTVMSALVVLFIAAAWFGAYPLAHLLAPGATGEKLDLAVRMSRIVLPAQFAFFIGGLMFGTLYARQIFAVPGLGPNVYNLGIIFGAVALSAAFTPGVVGMSWGALLGAILGNLVIPGIVMWRLGSRFRPSFDLSDAGARKVFRLMLPVVFGLSLPGVYAILVRRFASMYPDGTVAQLEVTNQLMQMPLGIFGQSLAVAVFPALSQFFALGQMERFRDQLGRTLRQTVYLSVPVSVLFLVAADPIVSAIFRQGKFTRQDAEIVAGMLRYASFGIWAWCLHPVLMRGFFAVQNTKLPILLGTVTTVVFLGLGTLVTRLSSNPVALPAASSGSAILLAAMLLFAARKRLGDLDLPALGRTFAQSLFASAIFGGVTWAILALVGDRLLGGGKLAAIGAFALTVLPGAILYGVVTRALGMPEAALVDRAMDRLRRRRSVP